MLVRLHAAALRGVDAVPVTVEVRVDRGIHFLMVGLPDSAIRESQQRIKSAIEHLGYRWPGQGITINLAPAGLRKEGAAYDLPLALGILAASGQIDPSWLSNLLPMGELALDGQLRSIRGALALAQAAKPSEIQAVIFPKESATEAAMLGEVKVYAAAHLREVLDHLEGTRPLNTATCDLDALIQEKAQTSLAPLVQIRGQERAIEAMSLAAAGGHNVCMVGPPGVGKTLLAQAVVGLLPPMSLQEAIEVNRIHSLRPQHATDHSNIILERPFRSPHHTISSVALVGGGADPKPGEISLAHAGVLFLDELAEMSRPVLEVLRQPLESKKMTLSRSRASVIFPADFQLIAAMNPCPCGRYSPDPKRRRLCTCSQHARRRYLQRISQPLLDRMDIHLDIEPVDPHLMVPLDAEQEDQELVQRTRLAQRLQRRVFKAREIQRQRNPNGMPNHRLDGQNLSDLTRLCSEGRKWLRQASIRLELSARAHHRILRMARTCADLREQKSVEIPDLVEALSLHRGQPHLCEGLDEL
jgi:magnesium chelatase family protein